jgi:tetratricopeptide (TPR) repeat protein
MRRTSRYLETEFRFILSLEAISVIVRPFGCDLRSILIRETFSFSKAIPDNPLISDGEWFVYHFLYKFIEYCTAYIDADPCIIPDNKYDLHRFIAKIYILYYFTIRSARGGATMSSLWLEIVTMEKSERTVTHASSDADTWIRHGDEMMYRGNLAKALENYDKAIQFKSDSARAWHNKANALEALGKLDDAVKCYDTALRCDPNDAECWFNKGVTLKKLGKNDDGAECINTGVNIAMGRSK